ncbi:MAG: nodulation protein NfeD [Acidimicrobiales bacterium]
MRRHFTLAIAALFAGVALVTLAAGGASAATPSAPSAARLDIVKLSGLIDPLNADLLSRSLRNAEADHALALIVQLNSTGGTVSQAKLDALTFRMGHGSVPVAVWVGGSGHPRAYGAAYTLLRAADFSGAGPGSRVGHESRPVLLRPPDGLGSRTLSGDEAVDKGFVNVSAPTLVDFLGELNGKSIKGQPVQLGAADAGPPASGRRGPGFRKDLSFAFSQLSVIPKLLHSAASPNVAFAMLLIALTLVVFEFFTAGVGVAAGTGALFGVMAAYGLGVLPVRIWSLALLAFSVLAAAVDVQAGAPRVWTAVGVLAYVIGGTQLYHGQVVSLWVLVVMGVLLAFFMVSGMPGMVRTRFSTPTIGRDSMVGTLGTALSGVAPDGTVEVNGAPWRARTNRATPIPAGDPIRVVAIDGLLLEVEPETGGAKDAHH